jgi:hypothetical protein
MSNGECRRKKSLAKVAGKKTEIIIICRRDVQLWIVPSPRVWNFPCVLLAPIADQAAQYPHNIKLYNLCRIKKVGLERWIEEEAGQIRKKYFKAKFVVGKGQGD